MIKLVSWVALLSALIVGCSPPTVESDQTTMVVESDLLGVWELSYKGKVVSDNPDGWGYGIEKIHLLPNGRYEQTFDDGAGGSYPKNESMWKVAKNSSNQQVVILDGLRNYKDGVANAVALPPRPSTSLLVQISSSAPFGGSKALILCHEQADLNFCFKNSAAPKR